MAGIGTTGRLSNKIDLLYTLDTSENSAFPLDSDSDIVAYHCFSMLCEGIKAIPVVAQA
jgi:hypothetical protein